MSDTVTVTAVNYQGSMLQSWTHLCTNTLYICWGQYIILFCHPIYTDYHYPMLTSNRSVSETEIQRMFRAATVIWSYVCAQEICEVSRGGTWDTVYFIYCKTQNTRTWKCLSYFSREKKNTNLLKTEKLLCLDMLKILDGTVHGLS